jgi:hypothetical protein
MTVSSETPAYVAPELVELGSFEEMTKASNHGLLTDVALPYGAPITDHLMS